MRFETFTATAPADWASYLINGDASGLEDGEEAIIDAWIADYCEGLMPVDCTENGFMAYHDAWHWYPLGSDCQTYTFMRPITE